MAKLINNIELVNILNGNHDRPNSIFKSFYKKNDRGNLSSIEIEGVRIQYPKYIHETINVDIGVVFRKCEFFDFGLPHFKFESRVLFENCTFNSEIIFQSERINELIILNNQFHHEFIILGGDLWKCIFPSK